MTGWIVETLIASSLLMGLVLIVRGAVASLFGPRIAYLLWLLPAARMVLPPLPAEVVTTPMAALPVIVDLSAFAAAAAPSVQEPVAAGIEWGTILLVAWLGGAALHFVWHLLAYRRFVRATLGDATQLPALDRDGIEVCSSRAIRGPFAAGIFVKTIVLPHDYRRRYEPDELRLAMQHEAEHHLRWDMSANLVALGMLSLHWFNPIAHRAHRAFRIDQELACDAIVLAQASPDERHAYGSALLKSTCDRLPVAACALGAGDDLKRRLKMMGLKRPTTTQARIGMALATVLTGGGLILTASGGLAAETSRKVEQTVRTQVIKRVAVLPSIAAAQPVVPVPPVTRVVPVTAVVASQAVSPVEDAWEAGQDRAETAREAAEAVREAHQAMREANAEAREAAIEAAAEGRAAARVALRTAPRAVRRVCEDSSQPVVSRTEKGRELIVVCSNFEPISKEEIRATVLEALTEARASIAQMDERELARHGRADALASIDREIAKLRAEGR